MIAHWMVYCAAVGVLLCAGAAAAERALRAFGRPVRWAWAAAIVLALAIPAAARWLPRAVPPRMPVPAVTVNAAAPAALPAISSAPADAPRRIDLAGLDGPLSLLWTATSAAAVLALLAAWAVLERRRRRWRAAEVDGVPVLLSPRTGPAVVGLFRSAIVVPEWVVRDAEPEVRALLLEHEREHLRAGDPRLLALGLAAAALMPWNPAAWWQLRRLRLAVEMDCDARVLALRGDVRTYGALLLEVGRRASSADRMITVAAFSEPASFLERRIRMMTLPRARRPLLRAAAFGGAAALLVAAACRAPGPARPAPADPAGAAPPEYTPRQAVQRLYPQIAQGTGDSATVVLYFDAGGKLVDHRMTVRGQRSGQPPPAAMHQGGSLERHHFAAGELGPDPVTVFTLRQPTPGERAAAVAGRVDTVVVPALATTVRGEAVLSPAATIAGTAEAVPVPAAAATRGAEAVLAPATTVGGAAEAVPAPATATTIRGTARAVAAPVTATTRGVEAVVVPATTARGTEAVIVPATATTRPVEATIVPGTATVRPTGAAVTPGAATVSPRDTVPVSVANPEELTRALRREYPAQFRAAGIFGTAVLELHVAADGTLSRTRVVESSHPAFGEAAVRAIAAARFRPARHRGVAVASTARIPLMFRLSRESAPVSARAGGAEGARLAPAGVRVGGAEPGYDRPPEPASAHDLARALGAAYPPLLRQAGVAADAHVLVRVSASGEVLSAQVVAASHPEAGAAAARVLSGTRFRPARKDGRPVAAEVEVPVEFRLDTRERP